MDDNYKLDQNDFKYCEDHIYMIKYSNFSLFIEIIQNMYKHIILIKR